MDASVSQSQHSENSETETNELDALKASVETSDEALMAGAIAALQANPTTETAAGVLDAKKVEETKVTSQTHSTLSTLAQKMDLPEGVTVPESLMN